MPAVEALRQFHEFVGRQLLTPESFMTPEQSLEAWRRRQPSLAASVADLESALDEMERGDPGVPARDFVQSLREILAVAKSP